MGVSRIASMGGGFGINIQHFIHVQISTIAAVDFSAVALLAVAFIHSPLFGFYQKWFAIDELQINRSPHESYRCVENSILRDQC